MNVRRTSLTALVLVGVAVAMTAGLPEVCPKANAAKTRFNVSAKKTILDFITNSPPVGMFKIFDSVFSLRPPRLCVR